MLKKNSIVDIYSDYQTQTIKIGTGFLKKKVAKGKTFILDEMAQHEQVVYGYDKWIINFIECEDHVIKTKPYPVRYIHSIGKILTEPEPTHPVANLPIDSFIKVNGIEIY